MTVHVDAGDNPAWITTGSGAGPIRYVESITGLLSGTITGSTVTLSLADPHGDVVTTVDVPTAGPATGISHWADYDDFGNPNTAPPPVDGADYGWLGAHQRATTPTGLLLMGARLYNPATAQFTSIDPVYGGNTTNYAYPQDPINQVDLDGLNNKGYGGGGSGGAGGGRLSWTGIRSAEVQKGGSLPGRGKTVKGGRSNGIGARATRIAIRDVMRTYGIPRSKIETEPAKLRFGDGQGLGGYRRNYDFSFYANGRRYYVEVKANSSPYRGKQKKFDLDFVSRRGRNVMLIRVDGVK